MYITGVAICAAATEMMVPETREFNKGLIFVKDTDILLSGDKWPIVVNIALDDYEAVVHTMKMTLSQISQKLRLQKSFKLTSSTSFDIHWEEINHLIAIVQGLDMDLQGFWKLLFEEVVPRGFGNTNARTKRVLIDILGYGMKYLFGTADAHDVKARQHTSRFEGGTTTDIMDMGFMYCYNVCCYWIFMAHLVQTC